VGSIAFGITARQARYRNRKTFDHEYLRREKTLQPSCLKRHIIHQSGCPKWRGPFVSLTELVTRVVELKISTNQNATLQIAGKLRDHDKQKAIKC